VVLSKEEKVARGRTQRKATGTGNEIGKNKGFVVSNDKMGQSTGVDAAMSISGRGGQLEAAVESADGGEKVRSPSPQTALRFYSRMSERTREGGRCGGGHKNAWVHEGPRLSCEGALGGGGT